MPKESGLNLLIKIKKMNIRTQVIIITGYGSEFSLTACLKNGADDFICKPFDLDDLKESIEHCCSKLERWGKIETAEKIGGAEINNGVYNLDLKKKKKMKRNLKL